MQQRQRQRPKGFSVLEILIAFTVFSVAVVYSLSIFPMSFQALRKARMNLMANALAQAAMEQNARQNFANVVSGTTSTSLTSTVNGDTETWTFNTIVTATPYPSTSTTCKDVLIQVQWTDPGSQKTTTLCTSEAFVADH
jgi:type II secretory pathway pseudopilin PulG